MLQFWDMSVWNSASIWDTLVLGQSTESSQSILDLLILGQCLSFGFVGFGTVSQFGYVDLGQSSQSNLEMSVLGQCLNFGFVGSGIVLQ